MNTIWKLGVPIKDAFSLELPSGAAVLCVQVQGTGGAPHIWAEVNPENPKKERKFRLFGTGHPIENPNELRYIGTFQEDDGHLIFHLYEQVPI